MGELAIRSSSHFETRQEAEDVKSSQNEKQKGKGVASGQDQMLSMMDAAPFGTINKHWLNGFRLGTDRSTWR